MLIVRVYVARDDRAGNGRQQCQVVSCSDVVWATRNDRTVPVVPFAGAAEAESEISECDQTAQISGIEYESGSSDTLSCAFLCVCDNGAGTQIVLVRTDYG